MWFAVSKYVQNKTTLMHGTVYHPGALWRKIKLMHLDPSGDTYFAHFSCDLSKLSG